MKSFRVLLINVFILTPTLFAAAISSPSPSPALASAAATGLFSTPTSAASSSSSASASASLLPPQSILSSPTSTLASTPTPLSANLEVNSFLTSTRTVTGKDATITTAPVFDGDVKSWIQEKWHLTTYWSCNTFDRTYVDCGWHEPVLPGGTEIAGAPRAMDARAAAFVAGAVMIVGAWL